MTLRFTETHEWITVKGKVGTVGVSNQAQKELGDIVYVELPTVGAKIKAGQEAAVLESTKAAADVYSPATGTIIAVNETLQESAELVNSAAESDGWLFQLELENNKDVDLLLTRDAYESQFN